MNPTDFISLRDFFFSTMKKDIFFKIILIFSALSAFYADIDSTSLNSEDKSYVIEKIQITGLKKTKDSYVQSLLKDFIGKDSESLDVNQVETLLQAQGIFSEINVSVEENTLNLELKEKISFLPLPFASYSSDGFMGGFMLMNMNAFGKKNNLITGGFASSSMFMGLFMFSKPAIDIRHPGFSLSLSANYNENEIEDYAKEIVYEADSLKFNGKIAFEEKFTPFFSVSVDAGYTLDNIWDHEEDPVLNIWQFGLKASLSDVKWNGWYLISKNLSARSSVGFDLDGNFIQEYSAFGEVQIPFIPRIRGILKAAGNMNYNKNVLLQASKSSVASGLLHSSFRTDKIASSSFTLESALFKKKVATLSLYGSYECLFARDFDDSLAFGHGPGAGIKLYMQQVAFPAMAMGFSYNIPENSFQFSASLGVAF